MWKKNIGKIEKRLKNWANTQTHRERNKCVASWKCNNNFVNIKTAIIITIQFARSSNNWAINRMANCQCNKSFDIQPPPSYNSRPKYLTILKEREGEREQCFIFPLFYCKFICSYQEQWTTCICIWFCILPPFLVSLFYLRFCRDKH